MTPDALEALGGRHITPEELAQVEAATGLVVPPPLRAALTGLGLIGVSLTLSEEDDASELGAAFRWMSPEEMIDEATRAYPGIVAAPLGFLPAGVCLEGSGDPYFLNLSDGAFVRIPHDAATERHLDVTRVETVTATLRALLDAAEPDAVPT